MPTVIDHPTEHPPEHDLRRVVRGHNEILAIIAGHAAERARELDLEREANSGRELDRGAAGPGAN